MLQWSRPWNLAGVPQVATTVQSFQRCHDLIQTISSPHGDAGERFVHLLQDSAASLFDLARSEGIDAEAEQTGWIQPLHTPGRMKLSQRRFAQWSRYGAPVDLLSRADMAQKLAPTLDTVAGRMRQAATSYDSLYAAE